MLIELIMFSAVVMVGIALLVSDSIKRVYSIATSMKVMVRAHLTTRSAPGMEGHWQPSRADVQSTVQLSWTSVARLTFTGRSVGRFAREFSTNTSAKRCRSLCMHLKKTTAFQLSRLRMSVTNFRHTIVVYSAELLSSSKKSVATPHLGMYES